MKTFLLTVFTTIIASHLGSFLINHVVAELLTQTTGIVIHHVTYLHCAVVFATVIVAMVIWQGLVMPKEDELTFFNIFALSMVTLGATILLGIILR